jgi:ureidoacrylate peracid hydrolase
MDRDGGFSSNLTEVLVRQPTQDFELASRLAHVRPLGVLNEKVRAGQAALVVVDMQNDFCADGGMMSREGLDLSEVKKTAERLPEFIQAARDVGMLVIFVRNIYSSNGNAYLSDSWLEQASRKRQGSYTRREVCASESWEGDFYGAIRPAAGDPVITKHRYSAFHNTDLDTVLRANGIRSIILTGVATNVCVETTAREGFVRDYYIVMVKDGCATYSVADHEATLRNIDRFFGEVTSISEIMDIWRELSNNAPESVSD